MYEGRYTGMDDKEGRRLHCGDNVIVHGKTYVIRFGTVSIIKMDATDFKLNAVEVACFYFDEGDGVPVFPLIENKYGKSDLETMEKI